MANPRLDLREEARRSDANRKIRLRKLAWRCAAVTLALIVTIWLARGLTFWTMVAIAIAAACPAVVAWTLILGHRPLPTPLGAAPETRGIVLDWPAPFYDALCRYVGLGRRFRERTMAEASLRPGDQVLDVGCGTGVLTRMVSHVVYPGGRAVGIDPAVDTIRLASFSAVETGSPAEFQLGVIERLPFAEASFDVALSSLMLHHLPPEVKRQGLREVFRVLKPGGRFVAVDLDRPSNPLWWIVLWPLRLKPEAAPNLRGEVPAFLREAGFDRIETRGRWLGLLTFWAMRKPIDADD